MRITPTLMLSRALAAVLCLILLAGCSARTTTVDSWQTDQPVTHQPEKVAVFVALPDALTRKAVEIDMAAILRDRGTNAVAASNIQGLGGGIRGEIDTEAATAILEREGVDGVVVSFYAGGGRSGEYVRDQWFTRYEGTTMGWGWAHPYFIDVYSVHRAEDIHGFSLVIYVESTYYDLETEQVVWRIVTQTKDVEHTDATRNIAGRVAREMSAAGLN